MAMGWDVTQWLHREPDARVTQRDVGVAPPPTVSEAWIAAAFAGEGRSDEQRELLTLSDELIGEVEAADLILIGAPMYNYGMPAALKAWFDQIIRIDRTYPRAGGTPARRSPQGRVGEEVPMRLLFKEGSPFAQQDATRSAQLRPTA